MHWRRGGRGLGRRLLAVAALAAGIVALLRPALSTSFAGSHGAAHRPAPRARGGRLQRRVFPGAEQLVSAIPPELGDLAQVVLAQEEEDNGPFGPIVLWMMSLDRDTNILIENIIFGSALLLTLVSAKVNFDKWQVDSAEKEALTKQNIRNAIDPDAGVREAKKLEEKESKGFANAATQSLEAAKSERKVRGSRRKGSGKTAMDEVMSMDGR